MATELIPDSAKAKEWKGLISPSALGKPNNKRKKIADLTFVSDIQQRPIDLRTVEEYAELLKEDPDALPRMRAIKEGDTFWVWDGFHRGEAHKLAGLADAEIYYTPGTKRDAEFLSFAANKDHGLPRQPGVTGKIVEKILTDDAWGKVTAAAIAAHVGCGRRYVEKVAERLRDGGTELARADTRTFERGGKTVEVAARKPGKSKTGGGNHGSTNGDGGAGDDDDGAGSNGAATAPPATHDDEPSRSVAVKAVEVDDLGAAIEREDVRDAFTRVYVLKEHIKTLRRMKAEILDAMGKDEKTVADPLFTFIYRPGMMADLDDGIGVLKNAIPYALCPRHAQDDVSREGCTWCRGLGWVPKQQHGRALEEMNAPAKVAKSGAAK